MALAACVAVSACCTLEALAQSQQGRTTLAAAIQTANTIAAAEAAKPNGKKPNILVIWGDDLGQDNISAYHRGLMGSTTPNPGSSH